MDSIHLRLASTAPSTTEGIICIRVYGSPNENFFRFQPPLV
ncbi:hypothetical protein V6Z12_A12G165900 [Gossypium hirsutum]